MTRNLNIYSIHLNNYFQQVIASSFSKLFPRIFNSTHIYKTTIGTVNHKLLQTFWKIALVVLKVA